MFIMLMVVAHLSRGADADHLDPVHLEWNQNYRKLALSKLCVTRFDCGRTFTLPAFTPESCVSVYSAANKGPRKYFVTYSEPEDSLWQRTDGGNRPRSAHGLKVQRIDADIPAETAEVLKKVWDRMLGDVRPENGSSSPSGWRMISVDGTDVEFSIERPNTRPFYGTLNVSLPPPGKKTKQLISLSNALIDYCKATPQKRPAIAERIDRDAKRLLTMQ